MLLLAEVGYGLRLLTSMTRSYQTNASRDSSESNVRHYSHSRTNTHTHTHTHTHTPIHTNEKRHPHRLILKENNDFFLHINREKREHGRWWLNPSIDDMNNLKKLSDDIFSNSSFPEIWALKLHTWTIESICFLSIDLYLRLSTWSIYL